MAHSTSSDIHALSGMGYRPGSDARSSASDLDGRISSRDREHYVFVVVESSTGPFSSSGHALWLLRHESSLPFGKPDCSSFHTERNWRETTTRHSGREEFGGSRKISDTGDPLNLSEGQLMSEAFTLLPQVCVSARI